jgi:hypothetical protein
MLRERTRSGGRKRPPKEMTLFIVSIPLMVLGFAMAIVPLVVTMRREQALEDANLFSREKRVGYVMDRQAHSLSFDGHAKDRGDRVDAA